MAYISFGAIVGRFQEIMLNNAVFLILGSIRGMGHMTALISKNSDFFSSV